MTRNKHLSLLYFCCSPCYAQYHLLQQDLYLVSPNPNNNHDRVFSSPSCNACIFLFYKQKIEIKKSEKKLGQCGRCWQSLEPNQLLSCYLLGFCPNNVFLSFNDNLKCQFHFPPLSMTIPYRDGARSENLIGQVVVPSILPKSEWPPTSAIPAIENK